MQDSYLLRLISNIATMPTQMHALIVMRRKRTPAILYNARILGYK